MVVVWVDDDQRWGRLDTCVAVWVTSLNVIVALSRLRTPVWVCLSRVMISTGRCGGGVPGGLMEKSGIRPCLSRRPSSMASQVAVSRKFIGDPPEPWLRVSWLQATAGGVLGIEAET